MFGKYSLRETGELIVSCSLYLNLNSILILAITALFLGGGFFDAGIGFLTGLSLMTLVYIGDRIDVTEEDRINNPGRTALVQKYHQELQVLAGISLSVFELSLVFSVFEPNLAGALRVLLGHVPLLVLYVYDDIKTALLPMDSLAVAFTWGYMLVYIFVFISPLGVSLLEAVPLFVSWFLIVFAGLEARNCKDIEGDREAGKVTLAVIFGARPTRYVEVILKTIGAGLLIALSQSGMVLVLLVIHIGSLWIYGSLESDFRCQAESGQVSQG